MRFHGSNDGIIITDLNGKKIAQAPNEHVIYSVKSHPGLSHTFMACGGSVDIFRGDAKKIVRGNELTGFHFYATEAELFPDSQGEVSVIAAGTGDAGVPLLIRFDSEILQTLLHYDTDSTPPAPDADYKVRPKTTGKYLHTEPIAIE